MKDTQKSALVMVAKGVCIAVSYYGLQMVIGGGIKASASPMDATKMIGETVKDALLNEYDTIANIPQQLGTGVTHILKHPLEAMFESAKNLANLPQQVREEIIDLLSQPTILRDRGMDFVKEVVKQYYN